MMRLRSLFVLLGSIVTVAATTGCGGSSPNDAFVPPPTITEADAGQSPPPPSVIRIATTGTPVTTEGGGRATFTVTLSAKPASDVVVPLTPSPGTEIKVEPTALTFTPADFDQPHTVTLIGQDDEVDDGDQKVMIAVGPATSSDAAWNGVRGDAVEALNRDDDTAAVEVGTPSPSTNTNESGAKVTFTVRLKSKPSAQVTIAVTSSVPTEGQPDKASLVFTPADWQTPQTVTVTGQDDALADDDKPYDIDLAKPQTTDDAYAALSPHKLSLTNLDDDIPGFFVFPPPVNQRFTTEANAGQTSFTIRLRSKPTADVTIPIASSKPTEGSLGALTQLVFTPGNYDQLQTVTVTGVDDKIDDGDQAYAIVLSPATSSDATYQGQDAPDVDLTNKDDDTAAILVSAPSANVTTESGNGSPITFTVKLQSQPTATVTLALASTKPGEGTPDKTELVFDTNTWKDAQTVTVTGADDKVDDGDQQYVIQITHKTGSVTTDAKYAAVEPSDVTLTNSDDDTQGVTVSAPSPSTQTTEGGGTLSIDVVLKTKPTGDVTIPMSISNGEAKIASGATSLTFTTDNWNVPQPVQVKGEDDDVDDGDQPFDVVFGKATGGGYNVEVDDVIGLTNVDDDTAGIVQSALTGTLSEVGGQAKFKVRLASRPAGTSSVTVPIAITAGNATLSASSLTFTTGGATAWNIDQEITVTGKQDGALLYTAPPVSIAVGASTSGDAKYVGLSSAGYGPLVNAPACGNGAVDTLSTPNEKEECDDNNQSKCDGCELCVKQSWALVPKTQVITADVGAVVAAGSSMCIEAWALVGTGVDGIIAASMTSDTDVNFALRCDPASGDLSFGSETTLSSLYATVAASGCNDGKWHHFSGCRKDDGTNITYRVFLDGKANPDSALGTLLDVGTAAPITFGAAKSSGTAGLDGAIDEAHLLTSTYRSSTFTPDRHPIVDAASTIALWHFNEGSGTTAKSAPANNYPATHANGSWDKDTGYDPATMCQ